MTCKYRWKTGLVWILISSCVFLLVVISKVTFETKRHIRKSEELLSNTITGMVNINNVFKMKSEKEEILRSKDSRTNTYAGYFQRVTNNNNIFVYSAIYDRVGNTSVIRTLLVVPDLLRPMAHFTCVMKNSAEDTGRTVKGRFMYATRYKAYKLIGGFVFCPVTGDVNPTFVSVLADKTMTPLNTLRINYPGPPFNKLTRCIPAVYGNVIDVNNFVTFIETNRYFGTDKFVIYNYLVPVHLRKVMLKYQEEGVVEIRNWTLPFEPVDIHYYGQLVSIHDCVFSQKGVAKYVILADMDEVVVPNSFPTLVALADNFFKRKTSLRRTRIGGLMFRNAYFPLNGSETKVDFPGKNLARKCKIDLLLHTNRSAFTPRGDLTKILIKPESAALVHVHSMKRFLPGYIMYEVKPKDAFMHHYKPRPKHHLSGPFTEDSSLLRFSDKLLPRIASKVECMQNIP